MNLYWLWLVVTARVIVDWRICQAWGRGQKVSWSRHTSPIAVRCLNCGWMGREKQMCHGYSTWGPPSGYNIEPVSRCPVCAESELNRMVRGD